jgi:hypothetical protein
MEEVNLPEGSHRKVRAYLLDELRKDLMGPTQVDEILEDPPTIHYLTGILYPDETDVSPDQDDEANEAAVGDDDIDPGTLMAAAFNPSAMGLTFTVSTGEKLLVRPSAAIYIKESLDQSTEKTGNPVVKAEESDLEKKANGSDAKDDAEDSAQHSGRYKSMIWKRRLLDLPEVELDTAKKSIPPIDLHEGLRLHIRLRRRDEFSIVTLSLVNTFEKTPMQGRPDPMCFFQPVIEVSSTKSGRAVFLARHEPPNLVRDPDRQRNRLLYRHAVEYAIGHGCAVEWEEEQPGRAFSLRTIYVPAYEALQLSPDWMDPLTGQGMRFLAQASSEDLVRELKAFLRRYEGWIDELKDQLDSIPQDLKGVGEENIAACEEVAKRMTTGIDLLAHNDSARTAFQLANQAMLEQRARTVWIQTDEDQRPKEPDLSDQHRWRPFQLGFILICLSSISDPDDQYRDLVDLLWFPTGGGKTEAYLGLSAFTIFLRRLRAEDKEIAAGVTIIMRYTLRLLTLQQYQRAASLIMACESIRREREDDLGVIPITLGLWVGRGATPNTLKEARNNLERIKQGDDLHEANPYQVLQCPWCGTALTPHHYSCTVTMEINCPNDDCAFHKGLPVYLIDEDIYRKQPTMIIGTVDKFARLPWVEKTGSLFGLTEPHRLPPELIIQDELHLITGPLGTLVGLYETAIDVLCTKAERRPKVIASTATIRRAADQVMGIFARELRNFPPQGLDIRDSFFAREVPPEDRPGRLFVGVHAPGKSMKTALLRAYAALLQRISEHKSPEELRDPYWTLVGYFNSLRELGGAVRLVDDDVRARMKVINQPGEMVRALDEPRELTSRISSREIPQILNEMFVTLMDGYPIDVLLATNMISVGVDVDRFGLMIVNGQPKMTSEYIQATSRVGRKYPGLIVTLYNWTRPRDRSHYERFKGYHSALYSQVEASSATPFSSRARDRGLHAVFITLLRHLYKDMRPEDAAASFTSENLKVDRIRNLIMNRVDYVDETERLATLNQIDQIIAGWHDLTSKPGLVYGQKWNDRFYPHLMGPAEQSQITDPDAFPTLNSLREVEGEASIFLARDRGDS